MSADIVQVLDWAIDDHEGMVKACELWRPAHEHCPSCQQRARHASRLRELRDAIVRYREAWQARLNSKSSTAFMERMHAEADALLAFCREAGA